MAVQNTIKALRLKRQTPEVWAQVNPILMEAEPGYEMGTGQMKIGDGKTRWLDLPYFYPEETDPGDIEGPLAEHIDSLNPHPAYDDGPSFMLLYENAKV